MADDIELRDGLPITIFKNAKTWTAWLEKNHAKSPGVWIRIAKAASGNESVTHPEALEAALCCGWIDGQRKGEGAHAWLQKFTPRGKRSIWSKVNRTKVLGLIELGRMKPAGLHEIERAKKDGRWDDAYDSPASSTVPADLQAAFDHDPAAEAFFATLDSANRYAVLWRIQTAKKAETRAGRIEKLVAMLARHEKIHP
jgi:uncharacterized protein YdeI (YjbR/CyaY-like superfamily)